jgi:hypothetical protein
MNELLIHTAIISGPGTVDQRVSFTLGSTVFTVGKTVTGGSSGASGASLSVTKLAGEWSLGTAAGYLVLTNVTGTFRNNEVLSDNGSPAGVAIASGYQQDNLDDYRVVTVTSTPGTTVRCRFKPVSVSLETSSGERHISNPTITVLPAVSVRVGYLVSVSGEMFRVTAVRPSYDSIGIHHQVCELAAVT